jgi:peptidoglycan/LPS O-acetylase OafA/YrhL
MDLLKEQRITNPKTNTECLNTVKFFGACIVAFVWHYQHFAPVDGSPFDFIFAFSYPYGWIMVELFFMLSGFGMMVGYGNKVLKHQISFPEYIRKRLNKIYPLFFVTLILVTILEIIFKSKTGDTFVYPNFDFYHLLLNVVLCQDGLFGVEWSFNSPSWCVSICFILYVVFFTVLSFSRNIKTAVYKFVCLGLLGSTLLNLGWNYPILNSLVARGLFCFSLGVVLAYFYQNEYLFNTKVIGYMSMVVLIVFYVVYRVMPDVIGNIQMLFILFIAPMIIISTIWVTWLNKFLSMKFLAYLGSLSMEIYLFHFIVQCTIKNIDIYCDLELNYSSRIVWVAYAVSTIVVSILYKQLLAEKFTTLFIKICDSLLRRLQ